MIERKYQSSNISPTCKALWPLCRVHFWRCRQKWHLLCIASSSSGCLRGRVSEWRHRRLFLPPEQLSTASCPSSAHCFAQREEDLFHVGGNPYSADCKGRKILTECGRMAIQAHAESRLRCKSKINRFEGILKKQLTNAGSLLHGVVQGHVISCSFNAECTITFKVSLEIS